MNRTSDLNKSLFLTEPVSPLSVHLEMWEKKADNALSDSFDKYAFYASRSIFVMHPEIYLRADRWFYKHISTVPGYKNAFLENDRESCEFLPHSQYFRSAPFDFDLFSWEDTKIITSYKSLYPDRYPFLPYLDRRMMPLATTLKTTKREITELEAASMRFIIESEKEGSTDEIFIVYSEEGMAWLACKGKIICAFTGKEVDDIKGNAVLIFNDKIAWYPLMGRENTGGFPYLQKLVERFNNKIGIPSLLYEEEILLEKIKKATGLSGEKQEAAALIAAVRSTGRYTKWFKFHTLWDIAMPAEKERAWQYYGFLEQILIRANTLSPIAAYMAACSINADGYDKILTLDREWIGATALPNRNYVWGHLWDECLVEYSIDESFRMNAGHCMVQSFIISSILDMAGVENYLIEGEVPGSHHYVFVPDYEFTFDNGRMQSSQNTIHWNGPKGNKVTARFHYKGKFASPIAGGHYSGTFSPAEAVEVLKKLKTYYNDKILIYCDGEHETKHPRIKEENIPTTENFEILLEEEWENVKLP